MEHDLQDATLVLLGHGSTLNPDSAAPTLQHADTLRARGLFRQVLCGFWKEEPGFAGVLRGAFAPRVFVIPLFISDGYFTEQVIPRELGFGRSPDGSLERIRRDGDRWLGYGEPVGTHDGMTDVILARAREVVGTGPDAPAPGETSLFIAGHGTGLNENSRKAIEHQVGIIAGTNTYHDVHAIFMEEDPRIGDCHRLAGTRNIVVVPFFIADGLHSHEDIPVMLGESVADVQARLAAGLPTHPNPAVRDGRRVWYARGIGTEPLMAEVILARTRELADRIPRAG